MLVKKECYKLIKKFYGNIPSRDKLLEKEILSNINSQSVVLDAGCGFDAAVLSKYSYLVKLPIGIDLIKDFSVHDNKIKLITANLENLPFKDNSIDLCFSRSVCEHLKNPYFVIGEISRILKPGGYLILSTPNILNLKSRMRFLLEGAWEYFREPPLDQVKNQGKPQYDIHIIPYRIHELEILLYQYDLSVEEIYTSTYNLHSFGFIFVLPLIKFQMFLKKRRSLKKGGLDFSRIHKIMLSRELLYGRHLILKARKLSDGIGDIKK